MTSKTTRRALLAGAGAAGALAALPVQGAQSGSASTGGTRVKTHEIEIREFKFIPASLNVSPGDRVRWINRDGAPHDATAMDNSWKTKTLRTNRKGEITVKAGMSGDYRCSIHPQMRATLVIATA